MTPRQKLEAQRRKLEKEKRDLGTRLGEIALMAADDRTDAIAAEATEAQTRIIGINGEIDTVEASMSTMPAETMIGDSETREFNGLRTRASASAIVSIAAAMHDGRSDHGNGALAEFQQHVKLEANRLPVEFLRGEPAPGKIAAAAGLTSGPTNVGTNEAPIETPVFADGDAAFCGVVQPIVGGGDSTYPEIATRPTVGGPHTDDTDVAETALTVNAELLAPQRLQASVTGLTSQMLRMPALEPAIRATLSGGLSEAYDAQCITELLTVAQQDAGGVFTHANYLSRLIYANVDGRYAREEGDIRVLMGTATMKHAASVYRANETATSALADLRAVVGGVRASVHIPAVSGNKQPALVVKGIGRRNAVCPIWQGVEIIVDRATSGGKGQIEIFGALYAAFSVSRTDGFAKEETQHA